MKDSKEEFWGKRDKKISMYQTNPTVSKKKGHYRLYRFDAGRQYTLDCIAAAIFQLDNGKNNSVTKITFTRNYLQIHCRTKHEKEVK